MNLNRCHAMQASFLYDRAYAMICEQARFLTILGRHLGV